MLKPFVRLCGAVPEDQGDEKATAKLQLVKETGVVTYKVRISTGSKEVPSGSSLTLTANPPGATFGPCTKVSGGTFDLNTITSQAMTSNQIDCDISVPVSNAHKSQGKISAFSVTAVITAAGTNSDSKEYHIPNVQTSDVPVYSGGQLGTVYSSVVTTAGAAGFFGSRSLTFLAQQA